MAANIEATHQLTDNEINNIVYLSCKYGVKWGMRQVDLRVITMMARPPLIGPDGLNRLLNQTAEYLWDHVCGETDEFTPEQLENYLRDELVGPWWNESSPEERGDISEGPINADT